MDLFCDLHRIAITEVRCGGFLDGMSYEGEEKKTRRGGRVASLFDFFNHVVTS